MLGEEGYGLTVAARRPEKLEGAVEELKGKGYDVEHVAGNLGDEEVIKSVVAAHRERYGRLDVLVNNAGVIAEERRESEDGYQLTFAVNYLAHFLLTRLLLPLLLDSAPARVVNVASAGQSPIDFDDVLLERGYDPMRAYTQSKVAQVMFTFELAERLQGSGVTVNALHPASLMDTKMVLETFGRSMSTVEEGAEATVRLATSPELEGITGRYFDGTREGRANPQAYDEEARKRLWILSEQLCGRLLEPPGVDDA
jgi:NAD(P)-dependent dehydrogenase (short-subunit alcohol dehydrogenase family)